MLSEKLKENTKPNHQTLEKKLVAIMRSIQSQSEYGQLLSKFYGYFGGIELAINKHLDLSKLPDYHIRRKTSALLNDLNTLGLVVPSLATDQALPKIENHYQALGALYVIEGSTLGGKIISKMLAQQMGLNNQLCMSFFNGYKDQTLQMWEVFKQTIDHPANTSNHDMIIQTANQTFYHFCKWFDAN